MKTLRKMIWIVLSLSIVLASGTSAQPTKGVLPCNVLMSNCTGSPGMMNCTYQRNVGGGGAASCMTTMSYNANCSIGTMAGSILTFNAMQTGSNPSCMWSCTDCPNVTIDGGNGLPVELLGFDVEDGFVIEDGFEVEDGDTEEDKGVEGEAGQSD